MWMYKIPSSGVGKRSMASKTASLTSNFERFRV